MKRCVLLLMCCLSVGSEGQIALAQQVPTKNLNGRDWAADRASRRSQAADWLAEVSALDSQIPTLSPAEAAWLKVEYDDELLRVGYYTPRSTRA